MAEGLLAATASVDSAARTGSQAGPRVIYLAGLGRSGSTLIERLLGEVPGVCALGEVVHLWRRGLVKDERCGCGLPFAACPFWQRVGEAGFGGWVTVDPERVVRLRAEVDRNRFAPLMAGPALPHGFRRALHEYVGYYQRLYQAASDVTGCEAIVDSSKHPSLAFCLYRAGVDVRVVHVVRDSRAVAYSWATRVARPDAATETYMRQLRPLSTATQWSSQNAVMHLLPATGAPVLRVRYEDVARSPIAALREIAAFAAVDSDDSALRFLSQDGADFWADLRPAHTVSGHRTRFTTGRVAIRPDDRWRTALPAAQRRLVTAASFPLLARYGYVPLTGRGRDGVASESPDRG